MAGASSIPSLVKSHPISLKDNLVLICCGAGIDLDTKDTKNSRQVKITEFSNKSEQNESKIREAIGQIEGKTPPKDTRKQKLSHWTILYLNCSAFSVLHRAKRMA